MTETYELGICSICFLQYPTYIIHITAVSMKVMWGNLRGAKCHCMINHEK